MSASGSAFLRGAAAAIGVAILAAPVAASAQETLRVGKAFAGSFGYSVADVGIKKGFFEKQGLKIELSSFPGGAKLQQAMAADAIDIGLSGGTDMNLTAKGAPMKAIYSITTTVEQVALVSATGKIKTVDDLKGSTWMAPAKASMPGWLPVELAIKKGWGADAVTIQTGAPPDTALALVKTGQIDAMTMDPASALRLQKSGDYKILLKFREIVPSFVQLAVFATDKVGKEKPAAVKKFVAAWIETTKWIKANKAEALQIMGGAINVPEEFTSVVYDENIPTYSETGKFDPKVLVVMADAFITSGMLDAKPDMSKLYTEEFLPK